MDPTDYCADPDNPKMKKKAKMKNSKTGSMQYMVLCTPYISYEPQLLVLTQPEPTSNAQSLHNIPHAYDDDYSQVLRSPAADKEDEKLDFLWLWMDTLHQLEEMSDSEYSAFLRFTTGFFKDSKHLW